MVKINIANFLLTRRCNLKCDYCRISGDIDYVLKPSDYPDSEYYHKNECHIEYWIDIARLLKRNNPDVFILIYGGEPLLKKGLDKLITYLNEQEIGYTIISNSTPEIRSKTEELFEKVGKIRGFTSSIDPGYWLEEGDSDEKYKSREGLKFLVENTKKGLIEDPVAEITVDSTNIMFLEETVQRLDALGIWSDITVIDIAKNNHYDFSSITNPQVLVPKDIEVIELLSRLSESKYKIHMKELLLPMIANILPAELHCEMGKNGVDNITIEPNGELRLCLRIRGRYTPKFNALDILSEKKQNDVMEAMQADYETLCDGCNWTCKLMSQLDPKIVLEHL
ncbi:MAG: radical SAM protein [Candidatus Peribacteraceae bacterium]|nr:radical SAM protein [Candidatus Peribacteraceae bacterium]